MQLKTAFDLQVLGQIALRLNKLHGTGFAHRNLNLDNVVWKTGAGCTWSVQGLEYAAKIGTRAELPPLSEFSDPQTIQRYIDGETHEIVDEAADKWALGQVARSLFTEKPPFADCVRPHEVRLPLSLQKLSQCCVYALPLATF